MGVPRRQRLRFTREIESARSEGRKLTDRAFVLHAQAAAEGDVVTKAGFVASRRVGGAVVRNLAKRRMRELFRKHQQELPPGLHLLVTARYPVTTENFAELSRRFVKFCRMVSAPAP